MIVFQKHYLKNDTLWGFKVSYNYDNDWRPENSLQIGMWENRGEELFSAILLISNIEYSSSCKNSVFTVSWYRDDCFDFFGEYRCIAIARDAHQSVFL